MKTLKSVAYFLVTVLIFSSIIIACEKSDTPTPREGGSPIITETGTPKGTANSGSIGVSGGTVQSADGKITVEIPAGALTSTTEISIQPITNEAPMGLGLGYRLLPEGTTFANPVQITFHYNETILKESSEDFLWIVTQAADGSWNAMLKSHIDPSAKTVIVESTHFSDWVLGRFIGFTLTPVSTAIRVGQSVQLKIDGFFRDKSLTDEDELAPLILKSDEDLVPLTPIPELGSRLMSFTIKEWAMNGTAVPVSNGNGSLTASGNNATYTAPGQKPSTNPVAISVELEAKYKDETTGKYLLISNITVESDYFVSLTIDGKPYEYVQYGFTTTSPPNPDDYSMVACQIADDRFELMASFVSSSLGIREVLELDFDNPTENTRALIGSNNDGNDVLTFESMKAGSFPFQLNYTQRTPVSEVQCDRAYHCGNASVTLTFYPEAGSIVPGFSEVRGVFSGEIYEDKSNFDNDCISSDMHIIEGEFWVMMYEE